MGTLRDVYEQYLLIHREAYDVLWSATLQLIRNDGSEVEHAVCWLIEELCGIARQHGQVEQRLAELEGAILREQRRL